MRSPQGDASRALRAVREAREYGGHVYGYHGKRGRTGGDYGRTGGEYGRTGRPKYGHAGIRQEARAKYGQKRGRGRRQE